MSTSEIIIAALVLAAVVGQFAFIVWRRNKTVFDPKHNAKKRADLIEREFDDQISGKK